MQNKDNESQDSTLQYDKALQAFIDFAEANGDDEIEFDGDNYLIDLTRTPRKVNRPLSFKNYKFELCDHIASFPLTKEKNKFLICGVDGNKDLIAFFRIVIDLSEEFSEELISYNNIVKKLKADIKEGNFQADIIHISGGESEMEEIKRAANLNFFSQKIGNKKFICETDIKK